MFEATWVMAIISGIVMLGFGAWVVNSEKNAGLANMAIGVGFLAYGIYLGFFFTGGSYFTSVWLFAAPFLAIGYAIKARKEAKTTKAARQRLAQGNWQAPPAPGQWPAQGAPGQWPAQGPAGQYPPAQPTPWTGQYPQAQPTPWTGQYPQAGQPPAQVPQPTWQPSANAAPFTPPAPATPPTRPTLSSDDILGR